MGNLDIFTSSEDKKLVLSVLEKVEKVKGKVELRIINLDTLLNLLNNDEKNLIKKVQDVNPLIYGFKGSYLGVQDVPNDLISISNQKYKLKDTIEEIETQYIPMHVFDAYTELNIALHRDTEKILLIESGYRSPAYQIIIFFWYLNFYKFNFSKTVKRVAMPGYSEHCFPEAQALDFITTNGIPNDKSPLDFAKTIEYKWLSKNANQFGFYESYPDNNKLGVMFEPWHWQFRK